jgi:DNA processing protein
VTAPPDERRARVALNAIAEPGDPRIARLVAALGAATVHHRLSEDRDLKGLRSELASRLVGLDPERILERAHERGIRFVVPGDAEWPERLEELADAEPLNRLGGVPLGLWVRGPLQLDDACRRSVAVVGSRSATTYGEQVALGLAADITRAGLTVVSGAAFGIDVAAHRGALAGRGPTVAVLACGADRAYPAAHSELLRMISNEGLVVSEVTPGGAPTRHRFLGRNRLIAGLTAGTVVVEAAVRSGALNTASWASRLNRPLMGVPGRVTDAPAEGVHELIRSGAATLVGRAEHVLELVSPAGTFTWEPLRAVPTARDQLPAADQRVLEAVPLYQRAAPGSIARVSGLSLAVVTDSLLRLRRLGWVSDLDGRWCRSAAPG